MFVGQLKSCLWLLLTLCTLRAVRSLAEEQAPKASSPVLLQHVEDLFRLGTSAYEEGDLEAAMGYYKNIVELDSTLPAIHFNLGVVYSGLGLIDNAKASYSRTLELKPDYAEALYNLGTLHQANGDFAAALALYEKAYTVSPKFVEAIQNAAALKAVTGDKDGAEHLLRHALTVDPYRASILFNLAVILFEQSKFHFIAGEDHSSEEERLEEKMMYVTELEYFLQKAVRLADHQEPAYRYLLARVVETFRSHREGSYIQSPHEEAHPYLKFAINLAELYLRSHHDAAKMVSLQRPSSSCELKLVYNWSEVSLPEVLTLKNIMHHEAFRAYNGSYNTYTPLIENESVRIVSKAVEWSGLDPRIQRAEFKDVVMETDGSQWLIRDSAGCHIFLSPDQLRTPVHSVFDSASRSPSNRTAISIDKAIVAFGPSADYFQWLVGGILRLSFLIAKLDADPDLKILVPKLSEETFHILEVVLAEDVDEVRNRIIIVGEAGVYRFNSLITITWERKAAEVEVGGLFSLVSDYPLVPPRAAIQRLRTQFNVVHIPLDERRYIALIKPRSLATPVSNWHEVEKFADILATQLSQEESTEYKRITIAHDQISLEEKVWYLRNALVVFGLNDDAMGDIVICGVGTVVVSFDVPLQWPRLPLAEIAVDLDLRFAQIKENFDLMMKTGAYGLPVALLETVIAGTMGKVIKVPRENISSAEGIQAKETQQASQVTIASSSAQSCPIDSDTCAEKPASLVVNEKLEL